MYIFFIALSIVECAPVENSPEPVETSSEIAYLPPIEAPPEIYAYEYNLTDTGYTYRWSILFFHFRAIVHKSGFSFNIRIFTRFLWYSFGISNSVGRQETLEIKNKGTPEEETVITGVILFKGDDGYRYFIRYTIDKSGNHIEIDRAAIHRIPPSLLKSLVG